MTRYIKRTFLVATLGAGILVSGCATLEGLKTDLGNAGQAVSRTTQKMIGS